MPCPNGAGSCWRENGSNPPILKIAALHDGRKEMYDEVRYHLANTWYLQNRKLYEDMGAMLEWDHAFKKRQAEEHADRTLEGVTV